MNILDWFNPTRWIVLGVVVLAVLASFVGYGEWRASSAEAAESQRWELEVGRMKVEAAGLLATETRKVLALERQLGAVRAAQEKTDAENSKTVAALREDLRRKSRAAGGPGLRDPFAAECGGGGGSAEGAAAAGADGGGADATETGRLLSAELEGFLIDRLSEADDINIAYASCRADSQAVRVKPAPP